MMATTNQATSGGRRRKNKEPIKDLDNISDGERNLLLNQLASKLAEESIVTQVLGRYLKQVLEFVHEEYIHPRNKRIKELEQENLVLKEQCLYYRGGSNDESEETK